MTHNEGATGLTRGAKGGKLRVSPAQGISFPVAPQEPPAPRVKRLLFFKKLFFLPLHLSAANTVDECFKGLQFVLR